MTSYLGVLLCDVVPVVPVVSAADLFTHSSPVDEAMAAINRAVESNSADSTLQCLLNEHLDLSNVEPQNAAYYQQGLLERKQAKPNGRLTEQEVQDCITEMNAKAELERMGEWPSL